MVGLVRPGGNSGGAVTRSRGGVCAESAPSGSEPVVQMGYATASAVGWDRLPAPVRAAAEWQLVGAEIAADSPRSVILRDAAGELRQEQHGWWVSDLVLVRATACRWLRQRRDGHLEPAGVWELVESRALDLDARVTTRTAAGGRSSTGGSGAVRVATCASELLAPEVRRWLGQPCESGSWTRTTWDSSGRESVAETVVALTETTQRVRALRGRRVASCEAGLPAASWSLRLLDALPAPGPEDDRTLGTQPVAQGLGR